MAFRKLKWIHNLKTAFFLFVISIVIILLSALIYFNTTGLPFIVRDTIEKELAKQNIHLSIGKLRYIPWRGVVADSVTIFLDQTKNQNALYFQNLIFDFDKTKALRGEKQLTKIVLNNASVSMPVFPNKQDSEYLNVHQLNGTVRMTKDRRFEIIGAKGSIEGVNLSLDAVILSWRPRPNAVDQDDQSGMHRQLLQKILIELKNWQFSKTNPPEIKAKLFADANKWSTMKTEYELLSPTLARNEFTLKDVIVKGSSIGQLFTIDTFSAKDDHGSLFANADYDAETRTGKYHVESSLDIARMARAFFQIDTLKNITLNKIPSLSAAGTYAFPEGAAPMFTALGSVTCEEIIFKQSPIKKFTANYAWNNGDFFMRDAIITHSTGTLFAKLLMQDQAMRIECKGNVPLDELKPFYQILKIAPAIENVKKQGVKSLTARAEFFLTKAQSWKLDELNMDDVFLDHKRGVLKGNVLYKNKLVSYELESWLPPDLWKSFFPNMPLEKVLGDFSLTEKTEQYVKLNGSNSLITHTDWSAEGDVITKNIAYRGTPSYSASCHLNLNHNFLDFTNIKADFKHDNNVHGIATADSIKFTGSDQVVTLTNIQGRVFPIPVLNMFAKDLANALKPYRFHAPPTVMVNGKVGVKDQNLTQVNIRMNSPEGMKWNFLDSDLDFTNLSGIINATHSKINLSDLRANVLRGSCNGAVMVERSNEKKFTANITWNQLEMEDISTAYQFKEKAPGVISGHINIAGIEGKTNTLQGNGTCKLEHGKLFAVPIFGPLSPVMSVVLQDKRAGYERAKEAFCTYTIKEGILTTKDFFTQTTTLKFAGQGSVNLNNKTIDMTMRMNAKGLFRIITFPLEGLFKFQGTGPLKDTKWEHVIFTPPSPEEDALLKGNIPKANAVE